MAPHDEPPDIRHYGQPRDPRPLTEGPRRAPSRFPEVEPSPTDQGRSRVRHDDEARIFVDPKGDVVERSDTQRERDEHEERRDDAIRWVGGIVAGGAPGAARGSSS